jgi:aminoglycoside 6'-N-acetyltransferase
VIAFEPLKQTHFELLYQWMQEPHVKEWWGDNRVWTYQDIVKKYESYVQGYKWERELSKPIKGYIFYIDNKAGGYIQYYNAYDFERGTSIIEESHIKKIFPSLAALDFYIGNQILLGKGLGTFVVRRFMEDHVFKAFDACMVDPDARNLRALITYQNAGFKTISLSKNHTSSLMIKTAKEIT